MVQNKWMRFALPVRCSDTILVPSPTPCVSRRSALGAMVHPIHAPHSGNRHDVGSNRSGVGGVGREELICDHWPLTYNEPLRPVERVHHSFSGNGPRPLTRKLMVRPTILSIAFIAILVNSAAAVITTYTSRASFDAAIGTTVTQNFNSYVNDASFRTSAVDAGEFSLSATGSPNVGYDLIDVNPDATTDVDGTTDVRVFTD